MESKIIQIVTTETNNVNVTVALCEDGSVWVSHDFNSWEPFENPFKAAQKDKAETEPSTSTNTQSDEISDIKSRLNKLEILVKNMLATVNMHKPIG